MCQILLKYVEECLFFSITEKLAHDLQNWRGNWERLTEHEQFTLTYPRFVILGSVAMKKS